MKKIRQLKSKKGFSLVELLIVIAILAVLVGVLAPQYIRYLERSRQSADVQVVNTIAGAIKTTALDPLHDEDMRGKTAIRVIWNTTAGTITTSASGTGTAAQVTAIGNSISGIVGTVGAARSNTAGTGNVVIDYTINVADGTGSIQVFHGEQAFRTMVRNVSDAVPGTTVPGSDLTLTA
jgi:type IV pilus assembly protein PilA